MKYRGETVIRQLDGGLTLSRFRPSLFRLIPNNCGNLNSERHIVLRFLYRFMVGYSIFILRDGNVFLAYAMYQKGKIARYPFVSKRDYLMGPYYVNESYRGKRLAGKLLRESTAELGNFESVYCWILQDNVSSQHAVTTAGYRQIGYLDTDRFIRERTETKTACQLWMHERRREGNI